MCDFLSLHDVIYDVFPMLIPAAGSEFLSAVWQWCVAAAALHQELKEGGRKEGRNSVKLRH